MNDTLRSISEQSETTGFKIRDSIPPIGRNPTPKKGKNGSSFRSFPRRGGKFYSWWEFKR